MNSHTASPAFKTPSLKSGRDRELRFLVEGDVRSVRRTAAAEHSRAVDDECVPDEITELARSIGAVDGAIRMQDEGAVAVVDT
jgi:hypothetical protein